MAIDANWSSVALLLPFSDSTNDAKGHAITAYGGAALSSSVGTPFGAGNALFLDGVDDYLGLEDMADFTPAGNNFTIEVWINFVAHTSEMTIVSQRAGPGSNIAFVLSYHDTVGGIRFSYSVDGSANVNVDRTWSPTDGIWYHLSVVRNGATVQIRIDGTQIGSDYTIGAASIYNSTAGVKIGALSTTPVLFFSGYIGAMRITNAARTITAAPTDIFPRPTISGVVYDHVAAKAAKTILVTDRSSSICVGGANSDPATGEYIFYPSDYGEYSVSRIDELADPYWNNVVLAARLTGTNGGTSFPTLTGQALTKTGTVTTTTASPTTNPFGTGSSALFTGAGSYLSTGSLAEMVLGTVYTISGWAYVTTIDATRTGLVFVGDVNSNSNRTSIGIYSDGRIEFYAESSSAIFTVQSSAGLITTIAWFHFAAVRYGKNALLFVNGSLVGSTVASGTEPTGNKFFIGASRASSAVRGLIGNMYDVKFSRRAEYLADFTVPASPFLVGPADGGSVENALIYDRVIPG
jgi:hypothetical protein